MSFPAEVVSMSLQYLNKSDLKNARLVSKQWSGCASEYLFTKLFVSPHKLNFEGFVTIAQDPRLSMCVEELEYDAVHFLPYITISQYFKLLWRQTKIGTITSAKECGLKKFDSEILRYLTFHNDLKQNPYTSDEIMAKAWRECCGFAFIQWGYWKWMEEARFEKECIEQKTFLKALISGLHSLTRLKTVKLRDDWPSSAKLGGQGSRLARSWNPLHAHPGGVVTRTGLEAFKPVEDFRDLTFALSKARVTGVRELSIECAFPPPALRSMPSQTRGFMGDGMSAYARLDNLKLSLCGWCANPLSDWYLPDHKVNLMLGSMKTLKRLELELPDDLFSDPAHCTPYTVMFPRDGHWPQVTTFTVRNLAISTKNMVTLFIKEMPSVRHLTFGKIYLTDGTWEAIVEFLRILHRLSFFSIAQESFFLNRSSYHSHRGYFMDNLHSVIDYVIDGQNDRSLKHPGLLPNEPAHYSLEYMRDVIQMCEYRDRDRLQEALGKLVQDESKRYATH